MKKIEQTNIIAPVKMKGLGHYFPGDPVYNEQLEQEYGFDGEWIVEHTGVKARHWPDETNESFVDMAKKSAEKAMEQAKVDRADIDLLICTSSTTRATFNPSTKHNKYMDVAPPLQAELGLEKAFVFDISSVACAGFIDASIAAASILNSMNKKNALVVCVENPKPILNFKYKNSTLFGAGAVAAVWQACEQNESDLIDVVLHSDGTHFNDFDIDDNNKILMKGKSVSDFAPNALVSVTNEILNRNGIDINDIDWFVPHQANINIINKVQTELNIPNAKLLVNIDRRGNTSSVGGAGVPFRISRKWNSKKR